MRKVLLFLGILDDSDMEWLIGAGERQHIDVGGTLIQEGQPVDYVFFVIDGALSVRVKALGGREIARLLSGEIAGEISFVDSLPPTASIVALERSTVLAVPRHLLSTRLEEDPEFAAHFYRAVAMFLADRLRSTLGKMGRQGDSNSATADLTEMTPEVLDKISIAERRFDEMQRRIRGVGDRA